MRYFFSLGIVFVLIGLLAVSAESKTLFEDDFSDGATLENNWELSEGAGSVELDKDTPPEYGPDVMVVNSPSGNTIAYVQSLGIDFTDGYVEILWCDADIPEDADGPLVARAQGMDEAGFNSSYLIEWDADTGLHLDVVGGAGVIGATGSMSDGEWVWLKFMLDGSDLKLKGWKAAEAEPADWMFEWDDSTYASGAVGVRAWSGIVNVAFFRVSDMDGPNTAVESCGKLSTTWGEIRSR